MMKHITLVVILAIVSLATADLYMHNPRGSNNRLNENNQNRNTANRLFDSQNNNNGGYNVGDSNAAAPGDSAGRLEYYKTSVLRIEWTNQHGALNENVDTQVVFQYACDDMSIAGMWTLAGLRDGTTTNRIDTGNPTDATRGRHEPVEFYQDCANRDRNNGLFPAAENVGEGDKATKTRQEDNGNNNRYGFECTEERDYYPYWHPAPWKDIAVLTHDPEERCPLYVAESQNVMAKGHCSDTQYNNRQECTDNGGTWDEAPAWGIAAPECSEIPWSRDNHLGNGIGGHTLHYNWTIPADISDGAHCVLRMRYNITTHDYDGWNTFYEVDEDDNVITPITNDPNVNVLKGTDRAAGVQLNVDTSQFGRTFQDRSHVFVVRDRPTNIPAEAVIYNLNVRGRRGNIVEVYPAVEYDFVPTELVMTTRDYVHIQWTGSLSTPDGAGQGTASTDKSNMVCIKSVGHNIPLTHEDPECGLFADYADHERFATAGEGTNIQELLNNAPATYNGGLVQFGGGAPGVYSYMCTRNQHFSNRSHKGRTTVIAA